MPAAAAAHVALAPAPPDRPPPPDHPLSLDEELDELELIEWLVSRFQVDDRVELGLRVDQSSTSFPRPNANSHGYQLSRRAGFGFASSSSKYRRPAVRRLRTAMVFGLCRDFIPLIDMFDRHIAHAAIPKVIVHGISTRPVPANHHRNTTAARLTASAGIIESAAASRPLFIAERNSQPGTWRKMPPNRKA